VFCTNLFRKREFFEILRLRIGGPYPPWVGLLLFFRPWFLGFRSLEKSLPWRGGVGPTGGFGGVVTGGGSGRVTIGCVGRSSLDGFCFFLVLVVCDFDVCRSWREQGVFVLGRLQNGWGVSL